MNELRIIRGKDIAMYADNTPLFGVTAFSAVKKQVYHEVYEYLSTKPCERVPQGARYELKLSMMTLFDKQLPSEREFTLSFVDTDVTYSFENCRICEQKTEMRGNDSAVEVFTVAADTMRKQVAADE